MKLSPLQFASAAPAALGLLLLASAFQTAHAQPTGGPPLGWSQRVNVGAIYQGETDLDTAGSFSASRYFVGADFLRTVDERTAFGFSLGAGLDTYDFNDTAAPWDDVTRLEASFTYARKVSAAWGMGISPSVQIAAEDGASLSDGVTAGIVASATHNFSPRLRLGLGVGVFTGLEETRAFPFLAIDWKISETWSLRNPFRPGPAGPAGIELVRSGDSWEFAFGGAYRSYRFKLSDAAPVAGGIGENNGVPLFLRATRKLSQQWEFDLYAGVIVGGRLELDDADGRDLADIDFDPAPIAAVTFQGRF